MGGGAPLFGIVGASARKTDNMEMSYLTAQQTCSMLSWATPKVLFTTTVALLSRSEVVGRIHAFIASPRPLSLTVVDRALLKLTWVATWRR